MDIMHANLIYAKDLPIYQREKPYQILSQLPNTRNTASSNLEFEAVEEVVTDIRHTSRRFTLDNNGFCHTVAPTSFSDWDSRPKVEDHYLPEVKLLLKQLVDGADEVEIFDWRVTKWKCFIFFSFFGARDCGDCMWLTLFQRRRQTKTPATSVVDISQPPRPPDMNDPTDPLQPARQAHVGEHHVQ